MATLAAGARLRTSVGLKAVMAVTGGVLVLFLVAHMLGNLKVFVGAVAFDHYASWLRDIGTPVVPRGWYLWAQRAVLTAAVVGHILSAAVLARRARRARPVKYAHRRRDYATRTMRWGGVIVLLFVIYHLLDLTITRDGAHPYSNVTSDFAPSRWPVTVVYALGIIAIGLHLSHGIASAARTLGSKHDWRRPARIAAALLCLGFLSVPLAVLTGLVR
jgi:succinate dehydrogenase / fumarate reductase cytochrome b subunit